MVFLLDYRQSLKVVVRCVKCGSWASTNYLECPKAATRGMLLLLSLKNIFHFPWNGQAFTHHVQIGLLSSRVFEAKLRWIVFITFVHHIYWSLFNLIIHNFIVHHSGAWWIGIHDCELMNLMNLRNWWIWWNWGVINHKTYMWVCAAIHDSTWHGFLTLQSDIWLRCITPDDSGFNRPGS